MTTNAVLEQPKLRLAQGTKPVCGHCGSTNVYGMSRVVGYFSRIENWNDSKKAELKARQKGKYKI